MRVGVRPEGPIELIGAIAGRLGVPAAQIPAPIFEAYFAPMMARTIMAGVRLGIFEALEERPDDATGLAERLELDPRGVDALLIALHTMGYVELGNGAYRNGEQAARHLVRGCERPLIDCVGTFTYDMWELIEHLEDAVRTGEPAGWLHTKPPDDPWWESYMRGLFELSQLRGEVVVGLIPTESPRTLLDIAGGHGGYSIAMCRRHPGLEATVVELEGSARIGREIVTEQGMSDQISFEVGDMFESDLGNGYDVAMANSILHHFDPDRNVELLGRARAALRPGGTMAVIELERPPEGKRGDQIGALTGVLFYVSSRVRTYTAAELEEFLQRAGYEGVRSRRHLTVPGVVVVTGRRPEEGDQ